MAPRERPTGRGGLYILLFFLVASGLNSGFIAFDAGLPWLAPLAVLAGLAGGWWWLASGHGARTPIRIWVLRAAVYAGSALRRDRDRT
ncbi:hypothetical protein [Spongiactinospora sp. TRM90649]|uniref:hypothetical protein n=1 Tax=Spongiactinospora sp. TRM90649 TaxID=3031114 RepID=UPI0023F64F48|nr:hypothetical protein [Spongiactinospora sp. TRM90649]MDF5751777.1 hypothetical protein [Spongiactinospora sp. TRM90649]